MPTGTPQQQYIDMALDAIRADAELKSLWSAMVAYCQRLSPSQRDSFNTLLGNFWKKLGAPSQYANAPSNSNYANIGHNAPSIYASINETPQSRGLILLFASALKYPVFSVSYLANEEFEILKNPGTRYDRTDFRKHLANFVMNRK